MHKGGNNESESRLFLKKMLELIAYSRKKAQQNTLNVGTKQVILAHNCFSEIIERWAFLKHCKKYFLEEENN